MRTNKPVRAFVCLVILSGMALQMFAAKDGDVFRGTVTFQRSGDLYFFMEMDAGDVWRVQRARNVPPVKRGDVVDVRGKKIGGIATPRIKADSVAVVGENGERLTPPEEVVLGDLLVDPLANTNVVNRFGRVVTVEGTVRDINRRLEGTKK